MLGTWSLAALAAAGGLLAGGSSTPRQQCEQPHYRWDVKTDTSLSGRPAVPATITDILTRWPPPALGAGDGCAPRTGRELNRYVVRGWIRRIEKKKDDGDWHIEVTAAATSPAESCIVVEIPLPRFGAVYRRARTRLDALLADRHFDKDGDLDTPLEVRIAGAAFYDGQHRRTTSKRDRTDGGHGRCNSSLRALWEVHPVYDVRTP
jgi:hypothetical protein